jgi:hypothetical protein
MKPGHIGERLALYENFMNCCRKLKACPNCALSAALYAAAQVAIKGLSYSEESFLSVAKEIFADSKQQLESGRLLV